MEDGLVHARSTASADVTVEVLILVVMEDGLVLVVN